MKYISKFVIAILLTMAVLAPLGAQAAVTVPGAPRYWGLEDFGSLVFDNSPVSTLAANWGASNTDKVGQDAVIAAIGTRPMELSAPLPAPTAARTSARPDSLGVFNSVAISAARLPATVKWKAVSSRNYAELFTDNCHKSGLSGCNSSFALKLKAVSAHIQGMTVAQVLSEVNRTVNGAMAYRTDSRTWGKSDYWANPVEIALKGAGDCEDFAIAKYWLLRSLGYGPDSLQVVVLSDTRRKLYHAVLIAHVNGTAYVLDNLSSPVSPDARYASYVPIMSFVGSKSYIHGFSARSSAVASLPADMALVSPGEGL